MSRHGGLSRTVATACLALIVGVAGAIRLHYANFALPYTGLFDEPLVVNSGLRILETGSYEPFTFLYGSLAIYLSALCSAVAFLAASSQGLVSSLDTWVSQEHQLNVALAGSTFAPGGWALTRGVFAMIGLLGVIATYRIARALGASRGVAVCGAAVVALHPLHLVAGRFATSDGPAAGVVAVALALAAVAAQRHSLRLAWFAAIAGGLSLAFKPSAVPLLLAVWAASFLAATGATFGRRVLAVVAAVAISAATFVVLEPFLLISPDAFLRSFGAGLYHYGAFGHEGQEVLTGLRATARVMVSVATAWPIRVAALSLGVLGIWGAARRWRAGIVVVLGIAAYAYVVSGQRVYFDRIALPLLAPVVALVCIGITVLGRQVPLRLRDVRGAAWVLRLATAGVIAVVFLGQWRDARAAAAFVDTRVVAEDWMLRHLAPGGSVAVVTQLTWAPTRLLARGTHVYQVDPWVDPCWYTRLPVSYFLTNIAPSGGASAPLVSWPGGPIMSVIPFLNPQLHLVKGESLRSLACAAPRDLTHEPFLIAIAGRGLAGSRDPGGNPVFELGFDGWLSSTPIPGGESAGLSVRADLLPAGYLPKTTDGVRLVIRALVDDQDVCVSRVPLPRDEPIAFSCPAAGNRPVSFRIAHSIEEPHRNGPRAVRLRDLVVTRRVSSEPFVFDSITADYGNNDLASDAALATAGFRMLTVNGSVALRSSAPMVGDARLVLSLGGAEVSGAAPECTVTVRGASSGATFANRRLVAAGRHDHTIPLHLPTAEPIIVTIRFENDFFAADKGDRNLLIYGINLRP